MASSLTVIVPALSIGLTKVMVRAIEAGGVYPPAPGPRYRLGLKPTETSKGGIVSTMVTEGTLISEERTSIRVELEYLR